MKYIALFLVLSTLIGASCHSPLHTLIAKLDNRTPHQKYRAKLEDKHLDDTPEGQQWLAASQKALSAPYEIEIPYRQNGYFQPDKPRALGLSFEAKQGEKLTFQLAQQATTPFALYADLFKSGATDPFISVDTAQSQFSFVAAETGTYILRLQPELFQTGPYSLSVSVGPSLGFPLAYDKAHIGSFWGDERDGGKRNHEGVDIFAPKLTKAVAAADGYITGVREGGLGGKTVWMKPNDQPIYLYYAHLDQQLVQEGQQVKRGDVLGLTGNTGNAKYTPSHLHFGVYTTGGPVNPLPFVNRDVKTAPSVPDKKLTGTLRLTKAQKTADGILVEKKTELVPLAVTSKGYMAELPDGGLLQVPFTAVKAISQREKEATGTISASAAPAGKR